MGRDGVTGAGGAEQAAKFDLEAEVRDLAARRDINGAVQRYMRGLDRLDGELQRSAFHDDAYVDAGISAGGPDDYVAFCQSFLAGVGASHHLLGQVQIDFTGPDTASGECYFQAWHEGKDAQGNPTDLFIAGRYVDEYACRKGQWRITKRRIITDWVTHQQADHGFFAQPGIHRGARHGKDFSQHRDWPVT